MNLFIRPATIEDLPDIYTYELAYIKEIEPDNESKWMGAVAGHLRQWIQMLATTYIVCIGEDSVGHYSWGEDQGRALLFSLYIKPGYRRKGLARRMLNHFEAESAAAGFSESVLGVIIGNPAEQLYLSEGYRFMKHSGTYNHYAKALRKTHGSSWEN